MRAGGFSIGGTVRDAEKAAKIAQQPRRCRAGTLQRLQGKLWWANRNVAAGKRTPCNALRHPRRGRIFPHCLLFLPFTEATVRSGFSRRQRGHILGPGACWLARWQPMHVCRTRIRSVHCCSTDVPPVIRRFFNRVPTGLTLNFCLVASGIHPSDE